MKENDKILIGPIRVPSGIVIQSSNLEKRINPGIGGSEFHSLLIAHLLLKKYRVSILVEGASGSIENIHTINEKQLSEFTFGLQIAPTSFSRKYYAIECPLLAVSHHPFDSHIQDLPERLIGIVNLGHYQFHSNSRESVKRGVKQIWIPNLFRCPVNSVEYKPKKMQDFITVGHLSSLHPSKGFHQIAREWMKFQNKNNLNTILEVIGGIGLYGNAESHNIYPVEKIYGDRLQKIIKGKNSSTIIFKGRISRDLSEELSSWNVAVFNPSGIAEADSMSIKECWRLGVPVIAGNRFGLRDDMRHFPELALRKKRNLRKVLKKIVSDEALQKDLSVRATQVYRNLFEQGIRSESNWLNLVDNALGVGGINFETFGTKVHGLSIYQRKDLEIDRFRLKVLLLAIKAKNIFIFAGLKSRPLN